MAFDSDTVLRLVLSQPNPFIELSYTACIIQLIFIQSSEPSLVSREFSGAMGSAEYRDWILKMSREREISTKAPISSLFHSARWYSNALIASAARSVFLPVERRTVSLHNFDFARSWFRVRNARRTFPPFRKIATANRSRKIFRGILISQNISPVECFKLLPRR